ncbi:CLUMA_CG006315, isoform A [Clunio marinus]|uniref:CLUMA_CG006315, isoform A n=1 Tax=Clunio marinus TaxID=568069 RepID=A0A1J1I2T5_9DIPT|nr:CLUMA_CG006315, isoform A [Clunio marinus]
MSAGMPELGSKISLISKADIRYEGRLFTVDPQECTIALANVRSFGTEDRETPYPIMPQPTVYDYILFRGSDIKDIRVVNNVAIPNDPAIMQMHLPPTQQQFPPQNFPPMQPGGAPAMAQFGPFAQMQGNLGPTMGASNMTQQQQQQNQSPVQSQQGNNKNFVAGSGQKNKKSSELSSYNESDMFSMTLPTVVQKRSNKSQDSRTGTPQNLPRKSPTAETSVQTNQNQRDNQSGNKDKPHQQNQKNNQRNNNQYERRDSGRNEGQENKGNYRNQNQRPSNQQQPRGYNNRNSNNNINQHQQQMRGNQGGSARMRGTPMHNVRPQQNNQNKQNSVPQQLRANSKPLKFENEFDFEQANSKFEELRSKLAKLKMASEDPKSTDQVNGEIEKKEDSGNETGIDHEPETEESNTAYDKNKSFFDNISCEAVERSKGKTQRTDWRQERKINSETFGYMSYNRRGNFRGRSYYQSSRTYRDVMSGYRPNYRPIRNHRNQNNTGANNTQNNQGNGQKSQNQSAPVAAN